MKGGSYSISADAEKQKQASKDRVETKLRVHFRALKPVGVCKRLIIKGYHPGNTQRCIL